MQKQSRDCYSLFHSLDEMAIETLMQCNIYIYIKICKYVDMKEIF